MMKTSLRALVVEDDANVVEFIRRTMVVLGHDCVCATNLQDAREALRDTDFHYVLLDLKLPAMPDGLFPVIDSGMTFLEEISRERGNGRIPVFVMTSFTDQGFAMAAKLIQMGAIRCIPKPLEDKSLVQIIREDLAAHKRNALVSGKTGQSTPRRRSPKEPQKVELAAPSTECYAELAITGDNQGLLKILFTKPGAGRPTEVASIPLRDQPLAILIAGIETALNRMRQGAEDLPGGRLPEECKIPIEWSRDSLKDHVKGTLGARRKAMNRLRHVAQFKDGDGLVSDQDGDSGLWRSTVPFRLRTSGKL